MPPSPVTRHPAPLIGITVDANPDPSDARKGGKLELSWNYAQAVADAGGVPLLIPPQADAAAVAPLLDGWLIPGGDDFDASLWGEETHPSAKVAARERFEIEKALYGAVSPELPVLGICYGCQIINVLRGGSLIQHLPDELGHDKHRGGTEEQIPLEPTSLAAQAFGGDCVQGRSYHHQAVGRVGSGLKVSGRHADGTVEAIEAQDRPWLLGVQWHPERCLENQDSRRLFESFVNAAREYRRSRG